MTGLRLNDWFCGAGGATQGAHAVPGIEPLLAANHDELAIATHSTNFPDVEHFRGDIKDLDVAGHPYAEIFWSSPECTNWSQAKGKTADYAQQPQTLFGETPVADDVARSRALMQDVIRYLEGMILRQQPVLAGVVENVVDIRRWTLFDVWHDRIRGLGYRTRLIALNSMHARPSRTPWAPQSRDRLYLAYWHHSIGRDPDWDRWLRPTAWCPSCDTEIAAMQSWKRPGQDMGRYRQQYLYRCPTKTCRGQQVEPYYAPALTAIDWSLQGQRIGDRTRPLVDKTRARIAAGIAKHWRPFTAETAGHTFERRPGVRTWPVDDPLKTLHTTQSKALLVPVDGRDRKTAAAAGAPLRTQTGRRETGIAVPLIAVPLIAEFRGGGSTSRPVDQGMATITANGNHHGLVTPHMFTPAMVGPSDGAWNDTTTRLPLRSLTTREAYGLLTPYYSTGVAQPTDQPVGSLTTRDRYALIMRNNTGGAEMSTPVTEYLRTITTGGHQSLVQPGPVTPDDLAAAEHLLDDCLFRMLEPHEIHAGMAFVPSYVVLGDKRARVKQLGNAVTPPVAEVLVSALVECIQGHDITWELAA